VEVPQGVDGSGSFGLDGGSCRLGARLCVWNSRCEDVVLYVLCDHAHLSVKLPKDQRLVEFQCHNAQCTAYIERLCVCTWCRPAKSSSSSLAKK
jgi:hypothetical protein